MTVDRYLRMIAGAFVLASLALGYWVHPYWYFFTAFVGLNLFQSAFTNWCPMMSILKWLGAKSCVHELGSKAAPSSAHPSGAH
jgi:hypothetical protein